MITIGYALKNALKNGYGFQTFKSDLSAAVIVALIALPLSMALAIAVELPPQHGLYTAIVAGIVVPLLGGSSFQVSAPTAAFVVVVAPIVAQHGLRGLIITTVMAGILLVLLGIARLGRYINYVPYTVTTGFTSGIAVVIGTMALNDLLGLGVKNLHGDYIHKALLIAKHIPTFYWPEALVGIISLKAIFIFQRIYPRLPAPVLGIFIGTLLTHFLQNQGFEISTIGNRFTFTAHDGTLLHGIPPFPPILHWPNLQAGNLFEWPNYNELVPLILPTLVVTALAALESLLSATVADGIAGTKHQPNSELVGIGIGNILSGLAAGMPATGAVARTATNIHNGAKTPLAATMHAVIVLLCVVFFAPLLSYMPMASLAALLLTMAYRMSNYKQFIYTIKIAPRNDTIVLLACFLLTVLIDMVVGVIGGIVLACFLLIKRIARMTHTNVSYTNQKVRSLNLPYDTMIYHINGALFFGTTSEALERTEFILDGIRVLIIDVTNVTLIDMTGLVAMETMILALQDQGIKVILCGPPTIRKSILQKLSSNARHKIDVTDTLPQSGRTRLSSSRMRGSS
jgi:SulP family sulfate permease